MYDVCVFVCIEFIKCHQPEPKKKKENRKKRVVEQWMLFVFEQNQNQNSSKKQTNKNHSNDNRKKKQNRYSSENDACAFFVSKNSVFFRVSWILLFHRTRIQTEGEKANFQSHFFLYKSSVSVSLKILGSSFSHLFFVWSKIFLWISLPASSYIMHHHHMTFTFLRITKNTTHYEFWWLWITEPKPNIIIK